MKTNLTLFLVVILLLSLAGNWIQYRSAINQESYRDQENSRFQKEQSRKLGQIQARDSVNAILDSIAVELRNKIKSDSTINAKKEVSYQLKIATLNRIIKSIDLSKSSEKELDSLIISLYGR